jgi:hypothetical protein
MEKITLTDCVKNEILHRGKEESNILQTVRSYENWNWLHFALEQSSKRVIEVKIEERTTR